eukprot:TRINITY_DN12376_c0_g1_i1.p1 TRINITY_DN12376_c0_g1~~TRINITY_DN12376_c0_g1_i1.p1  ORF type:complete len:2139 (+),score=262.87 TRINITY_DN12376_c0_g1_i1:996-7412(+)
MLAREIVCLLMGMLCVLSEKPRLSFLSLPGLEGFVLAENRDSFVANLSHSDWRDTFFVAVQAQNRGDLKGSNLALGELKKLPIPHEVLQQLSLRHELLADNPRSVAEMIRTNFINPNYPTPISNPYDSGEKTALASSDSKLPAPDVLDYLLSTPISETITEYGVLWIIDQFDKFNGAQRENAVRFLQNQQRHGYTSGEHPNLPLVLAALHAAGIEIQSYFPILSLSNLRTLAEHVPRVRELPSWLAALLRSLKAATPLTELLSYADRALEAIPAHLTVHNEARATYSWLRVISHYRRGNLVDPAFISSLGNLPFPMLGALTPNPSVPAAHFNPLWFDPAVHLPSADALEVERAILFHCAHGGAESLRACKSTFSGHWVNQTLTHALLIGGNMTITEAANIVGTSIVEKWATEVLVELPPWNPRSFAESGKGRRIRLQLQLKNVDRLVVNVYRLNLLNFYQGGADDTTSQPAGELDTGINLEGLRPSSQRTIDFPHAPRHILHTADLDLTEDIFPAGDNTRLGAWMIDFVGGSNVARALVRIGSLDLICQTTKPGVACAVLGGSGEVVLSSAVWLNGREHVSDEAGLILLPFATESPGARPVIVADRSNDLAALANVQLPLESFSLDCKFAPPADEAFVVGREISVLVFPLLTLGEARLPLEYLEDLRVTLYSTDAEGVASESVLQLQSPDEESGAIAVIRVAIPPALVTLKARLSAKVRTASGAAVLVESQADKLYEVSKSTNLDSAYLTKARDDYQIVVLGRDGLPVADQSVKIDVHRLHFRQSVTLATNAAGVIELGPLRDAITVHASIANGQETTWNLPFGITVVPPLIIGTEDQPIYIALDPSRFLTRPAISLVAIDGSDHFDSLRADGNGIVAGRLGSGEYRLAIRGYDTRTIKVVVLPAGISSAKFGTSFFHVPASIRAPLRLKASVAATGDLFVKLENRSRKTRVHVVAARFHSEAFANTLRGIGSTLPEGFLETTGALPKLPEVLYAAGGQMSDEMRYVMDRRHHPRSIGNPFDRPSLLVVPRELNQVDTLREQLNGGVPMGRADFAHYATRSTVSSARAFTPFESPSVSHELVYDFLATPPVALFNLLPDKDGKIILGRDQLAGAHLICVVATDATQVVFAEVSAAAQKVPLVEVRLTTPLNPDLVPAINSAVVSPGSPLVVDGDGTGSVVVYDSVAKLMNLARAATAAPTAAELQQFSFLPEWPALSLSRKEELYSKHAGHELNTFLRFRDPEFFQRVVLPHVRAKATKTMIDWYVLTEDTDANLRDAAKARLRTYGGISQSAKLHLSEKVLLLHGLRSVEGATKLCSFLQYEKSDHDSISRAALQGGLLSEPVPGIAELTVSEDASNIEDTEDFEENFKPKSSLTSSSSARFAVNVLKQKTRSASPRVSHKPAYQPLGRTYIVTETHYRSSKTPSAASPAATAYWRDAVCWMSSHEGSLEGFASPHLAEAINCLAEFTYAIGITSLPLGTPAPHTVHRRNDGITVSSSKYPVVVYFRDFLNVSPAQGVARRMLLDQSVSELHSGVPLLPDAANVVEALPRVVYHHRVTVTNASPRRECATLVFQVPEWAVVLGAIAGPTLHRQICVEAFNTASESLLFYFPRIPNSDPEPGNTDDARSTITSNSVTIAAQYPATLARDGFILERTAALRYQVVQKLSRKEDWKHIAAYGSAETIVNFLRSGTQEAATADLERLLPRLHSKQLFRETVAVLRSLNRYDANVWSFVLLHPDRETLAEYLADSNVAQRTLQLPLASPLLAVGCPLSEADLGANIYGHLEYHPLINPRAHPVGGQRQALNAAAEEQYRSLLEYLVFCAIDSDRLLAVSYYLLLQDRISEVQRLLPRLRATSGLSLQHAYLRAYLAVSAGDLETAHRIASNHVNTTVSRWHSLFHRLLTLTGEALREDEPATLPQSESIIESELDGKAPDRTHLQAALADNESDFLLEAQDSNAITVSHRNLKTITLRFYPMDLELTFSSRPFLGRDPRRLRLIAPALEKTVALSAEGGRTFVSIPESFATSNVLIEGIASVGTRTCARYANDLTVTLSEAYGWLEVRQRSTNKRLGGVYVKAYARTVEGKVVFMRDGYTDFLGKFDYASTNAVLNVDRFALLVLSDEFGAIVREAAPPLRK